MILNMENYANIQIGAMEVKAESLKQKRSKNYKARLLNLLTGNFHFELFEKYNDAELSTM